jgi:hypothetical protein
MDWEALGVEIEQEYLGWGLEASKRVQEATGRAFHVLWADASTIGNLLHPSSVDAVVTSPPYVLISLHAGDPERRVERALRTGGDPMESSPREGGGRSRLTSSSEAGFTAESCLEGGCPNSRLRMRVCRKLPETLDKYHVKIELLSLGTISHLPSSSSVVLYLNAFFDSNSRICNSNSSFLFSSRRMSFSRPSSCLL